MLYMKHKWFEVWIQLKPDYDSFLMHHSRSHTKTELRGNLHSLIITLISGVLFNDLVMFEPAIVKWSRPSMTGNWPSPRKDHGFTSDDSQLYVFGGEGFNGI